MRKLLMAASVKLVLGFFSIFILLIFGNISAVKAEEPLTVEGVWQVVSSNWPDCYINDKFTIVRKGTDYDVISGPQNQRPPEAYVNTGLYYGTNSQIMTTATYSYDDLLYMYKGTSARPSDLKTLSGKITARYRITLSADANSAEYAVDKPRLSYSSTGGLNYEIVPYAYITKLTRISSSIKTEDHSGRAYQADCGKVDPNRTTPFPPDHEFCPGNLVCMTNFCGGGMGCPYVCCPKGMPYLNHCDCKCYATSDFDCHSYSYGREKLIH